MQKKHPKTIKFTLNFAFIAIMGIICQNNTAKAQSANISPLQKIYDCVTITDNIERLKCYDDNVKSVEDKEKSQEIITIDKQKIEAIQTESFGFQLPSFGKITKDIKSNNKVVALTAIKIKPSGETYIVEMQNGQKWQIIDSESVDIIKTPSEMEIRNASFGSFLMNIKGRNRTWRVKRVE